MRIPQGLRSALASQTSGGGGGSSPTTDEYFSDVSLLLYGDGTNGSTAIVDSSRNGHAITVNGDAQISTAQSKFGGASMYFDGTGDYITAPSDSSFDFGTGDFTIEFWMNPSNITGTWQAIISRKYQGSGGWRIYKTAGSNNLSFYHPSGYYSTTNTGLTNGTWHHIAVVRSGSTLTTYIDGTSRGTDTISLAMSPTSADVEIGQGVYTSSYPYEGYLDDIRITKGVARYTANFTPPTASFSTVTPGEKYFYQNSLLLSADGSNGSTAIVDSSSNTHTITVNGDAQISTTQSKFGGSSLYFDGNGDFLSAPTDPSFEFGTGDFTVELWANISSLTAGNYQRAVFAVLGNGGVGGSNPIYKGWSLQYVPGTLMFGRYDGTSYSANFSTTLSLNTWYHIAVSRSGTSIRAFVNGTQVGSTLTDNVSYNKVNNDDFRVGYMRTGSYGASHDFYHGYIDDLRITKGVARYTSNFTIPTSEASSTDPYFSNTGLLLNGNGTNGSTTFTDSSNSSHTVTVNGNAQISTTQSKFGGSSMYFDGSGDYLVIAQDTSTDLSGVVDFTIEAWVRPANVSGTRTIFSQWNLGGSGPQWYIENTKLKFGSYRNGGGAWVTGSTTLSVDTWYHVAVVRSGSTINLFVNGQPDGSRNYTLGMYTYDTYIGNWRGYNRHFEGYIDDFRITKGVARYGNFAVPTAGFSTLTPFEPYFHNNSLLLYGDGTNGSTTFKDDSINNHTITANGNAQISTTQSKFGGASMYFDGNGDYLSIPYDSTFDFPGDFTVEFWVRRAGNSTGGAGTTYEGLIGSNASGVPRWTVYLNRSTKNIVWFGNDGSLRETSGTTISDDTWYHIAWSRNGTTLKGFINGTQVYSATTSTSYTTRTSGLRVGHDLGANRQFYGYIDDLRITKGVARYTANFTAPLASFATPSPTLNVESLIVAGGGAGNGAGGGAGGLLHYTTLNVFKNNAYTITVGAGGNRANNGPLGWGGEHGGDSSVQVGATNFVATGGGGGAAGAYANGTNNQSGHIGGAGGSGGGGGNNAAVTNVAMPGGSGITGQGNAGGSRTAISGSPAAGGGGHAAAGSGNIGGAGTAISIINTTTATSASVGHVSGGLVYFAGGGGGGSYNSPSIGGGGLGGGGVGRKIIDGYDSSQNGLAHTGGGGGGGPASDGGSGVVIFRFPQSSSYQATGTYSAYSESTDTIVIFKGTGTIKWT